MKGPPFFKEDYSEIAKIHWQYFFLIKNFQFQPNFKFFQLNGHALFQEDKNNEIAKFKKIFFSRTIGPISTKLGTMYLCVKGTQVLINKQPSNSQKRDNDFFFSKGYVKITALRNVFIHWNCFLCARCGPGASCYLIWIFYLQLALLPQDLVKEWLINV